MISYSALFLGVTYSKRNSNHILTQASSQVVHFIDKQPLMKDIEHYHQVDFYEDNNENISILDCRLKNIIQDYNVKMVYVYGDNQIFHKLFSLMMPNITVVNVKTFSKLDLFKPYNTTFHMVRCKEYPTNKGTMKSIINICGLISQNYVLRYDSKKIYPNFIVSDAPCCTQNVKMNIFRVILYAYVCDLLAEEYTLDWIESLFQQILLNMFFPTEFSYSLHPYKSFTRSDKVHHEICSLEDNLKKMGVVNHSPKGLINLEYLENREINVRNIKH